MDGLRCCREDFEAHLRRIQSCHFYSCSIEKKAALGAWFRVSDDGGCGFKEGADNLTHTLRPSFRHKINCKGHGHRPDPADLREKSSQAVELHQTILDLIHKSTNFVCGWAFPQFFHSQGQGHAEKGTSKVERGQGEANVLLLYLLHRFMLALLQFLDVVSPFYDGLSLYEFDFLCPRPIGRSFDDGIVIKGLRYYVNTFARRFSPQYRSMVCYLRSCMRGLFWADHRCAGPCSIRNQASQSDVPLLASLTSSCQSHSA